MRNLQQAVTTYKKLGSSETIEKREKALEEINNKITAWDDYHKQADSYSRKVGEVSKLHDRVKEELTTLDEIKNHISEDANKEGRVVLTR